MLSRLSILVAGLAGAALAAGPALAGDRYGGTSGGEAVAGQRYLGWSGKVQPSAERNMVPEPARPEPLALAGQYARGRQMGPPAPAASTGPAFAPFVPQTPLSAPQPPAPTQPQSPPSALPTSLYTPPPADAQIGAPTRIAAAASRDSSRLYSVHRPYGLAPDAIPEPPAGDRYVLIGPPDSGGVANTPADDADDDSARKGERPF